MSISINAQCITASPLSITAIHAIRSEASEYRHFITILRTIRQLFADGKTDAARSACEALIQTAHSLQSQAIERSTHFDLKHPDFSTEDYSEAELDEYDTALCELLTEQMTARCELVATIEILQDLKMHTAAFRRTLLGQAGETYNRQGQTSATRGIIW